MSRQRTRSRANSVADRMSRIMAEEALEAPLRPTISSRSVSGQASPRREPPAFDLPVRPSTSRSGTGFEGPTSLGRSPPRSSYIRPSIGRAPTEPLMSTRNGSRATWRDDRGGEDVFGDDHSSDSSDAISGSDPRATYWSGQESSSLSRKAPPPPPPSRSKKPPPPLPMKRSALSTSEVPRYH